MDVLYTVHLYKWKFGYFGLFKQSLSVSGLQNVPNKDILFRLSTQALLSVNAA